MKYQEMVKQLLPRLKRSDNDLVRAHVEREWQAYTATLDRVVAIMADSFKPAWMQENDLQCRQSYVRNLHRRTPIIESPLRGE